MRLWSSNSSTHKHHRAVCFNTNCRASPPEFLIQKVSVELEICRSNSAQEMLGLVWDQALRATALRALEVEEAGLEGTGTKQGCGSCPAVV